MEILNNRTAKTHSLSLSLSLSFSLYILKKRQIFVPQGTPFPLKHEEKVSDYIVTNGPSIDGSKNAPKSMFVYSQNKFSLKCCPSTYSSDKGCVCTSKKQNNFISQRGSI